MEHRWGQREDVSIPVRLRWHQRYGAATGEISNISQSGAWIETNAELPLLAPLDVDMLTAGGRGAVAAYVVRKSSGGCGIEWSEPLKQRFQPGLHDFERVRILGRNAENEAGLR